MPLVSLPWQKRTEEASIHATYSELMSRDSARRITVTVKYDLEGAPEYWDLSFGMGIIRLYLADETVLELIKQIEAQRAWSRGEGEPKR